MGQKKIVIGTAEALPGKKGEGFIHVADRPDGTPINIPIIILNGASEGPVLCVDGCNHGDECETMEAVLRVVDLIDPSTLQGTLLAVPVVNVPAYEAMQRMNPNLTMSWSDINRIYPGKIEGSITDKIAYQHFNQVVCKAEYLINLHNGANYWLIPPKTFYVQEKGELGEKVLGLARAFGFDILFGSPPFGATERNAATKRGIAAITPECAGGSDRAPENRDHNVGLYVKGILNVMKYLGMIDGSPDLPSKYWMVEGESHICFAKHGGLLIFERGIQLKQKVKKGQKLGKVVNLFGEEVESINAEFDGLVVTFRSYPLINPGDFAIGVARIVEEGS
jgi:predicted deacylase